MSDSDNENYAFYGDPLEPLDEDNIPKKKSVTVEDQYALDAQGRRRFHGAFTGGFSAGYFNSVGTRDGWRPHQFKSSRGNKAEAVTQRPEDFMDEEDTGDFGIAPSRICTSSDYADHREKGTKRGRVHASEGPIPGIPILEQILEPVKETIGVKLLKEMGWKPGQGVGPRLTKKEKKKIRKKYASKKIYGCALPNQEMKTTIEIIESSDDDDDDDDDNDDENILYAPDDFQLLRIKPKDNFFGIGYTGLDRSSLMSGSTEKDDTSTFQLQEKNKKLSIRGQAFGVGAFEAEDDDIYERDDMSQYDFTLGPESKSKNRQSARSLTESSQEKCLEGFVLAKNVLKTTEYFPLPEIPKDYVPIHVTRKSRFSPEIISCETSHKSTWNSHGRRMLNVDDRQKILGESDVSFDTNNSSNKINKSVEKLGESGTLQTLSPTMQQKSIEKCPSSVKQKSTSISWMDKLTVNSFISAGIEKPSENNSKSSTAVTETIDPTIKIQPDNSNSSQHAIKPFIHDPEKQKRFEKFIEFSKNNQKEKLEYIQPLSMGKWERERELEEFENARKSCKQVNVSECKESETTTANVVFNDTPLSAARMKMFGKLTRTIEIWKPTSAVCKRFNIAEPKVGCAQPETEKAKKYRLFESLDFCGGTGATNIKFQKAESAVSSDFVSNKTDKSFSRSSPSVEAEPKLSQKLNLDIATNDSSQPFPNFKASSSKLVDKNIRGTSDAKHDFSRIEEKLDAKNESPMDIQVDLNSETKADLYKAIFLSSSESSDSENESTQNLNSETVKSLLIGKPANELNTQRNTSPPRGIFAKLNLDEMILSKRNNEAEHKKSIELTNTGELGPLNSSTKLSYNNDSNVKNNPDRNMHTIDSIKSEVEMIPDMYGPALPIKPVNSDNQPSLNQSQTGKPIFKSVIIPKLNNDGKVTKWIEKIKEKKSKKDKKKHKQKEKHKDKKHKHKSKKKK